MTEVTREGLEPLSTIGTVQIVLMRLRGSPVKPSSPGIGNCQACYMDAFCVALIRTLAL